MPRQARWTSADGGGDVDKGLVNPLTGERLIITRTTEASHGRLLEIKAWLPAHWREPWRHLHPHQDERIEVLAGTLVAEIDGRVRHYRQGESLIVPPGMPHLLSTGPQSARLLLQLRPALRTEELLQLVHRLAGNGRGKSMGRPKVLAAAVLIREFDSEVRIVQPPLRLMPAVTLLLARIARLRGGDVLGR